MASGRAAAGRRDNAPHRQRGGADHRTQALPSLALQALFPPPPTNAPSRNLRLGGCKSLFRKVGFREGEASHFAN
jgi:hypothetical protein